MSHLVAGTARTAEAAEATVLTAQRESIFIDYYSRLSQPETPPRAAYKRISRKSHIMDVLIGQSIIPCLYFSNRKVYLWFIDHEAHRNFDGRVDHRNPDILMLEFQFCIRPNK